MTNSEIAKKLHIAEKTIYNWRKNRKELFEIIQSGIDFQEAKKNIQVNSTYKEIISLLDNLSKQEIDYYISDIKTRILKKELDIK